MKGSKGERIARVDEADTVEKLLLLAFTVMDTIVRKLTKFLKPPC